MTVKVVRAGGAPDGATVVAGQPAPAATAAVGIPRPSLGQLTDVDGTRTAPAGVPLSLVKGADGVFRLAAGPPGPAAAPALEHLQSEPATVWGPIEHGLGRYPVAWSMFDSDGRECGEYVVQHLDLNTLRVSMDVATAGVFRFL